MKDKYYINKNTNERVKYVKEEGGYVYFIVNSISDLISKEKWEKVYELEI